VAGRWDSIIWDFNGTLVDDVDLALRSINAMLIRRGLPVVPRSFYRSVFGFPLLDYYRKLGIDVERETPEGLADEFHAAYLPGLPACDMQGGVREALEVAAGNGARQFVLSALEESLLREALTRLRIAERFEGIYGLDHRLADSKLARGRVLFRDHGLRANRTLFIGDMDHDAEVALALGVDVALVARGHQSVDRLRACGCRVVESVRDLWSEFVGSAR
jgi:phosphoglycolate phosphatase